MKYKKNILIYYFIIIIILSSLLYVRLQNEHFTNSSVVYDIIILAGQSNSIGRGTRNHQAQSTTHVADYGRTSADNENIKIKQIDIRGNIAPGVEPISAFPSGGKNQPTLGHGLSFAKEYLRKFK